MITVVSWNMDGNSDAWELLLSMGADIALLQDPGAPSDAVAQSIGLADPPWELERRQRPPIIVQLSDRVAVEWFSPVPIEEVTTRTGNVGASQIAVSDRRTIAVARVVLPDGAPFFAVSMYGRWLGSHPLAASASATHADASTHRIISDISALSAAGDPSRHRILAAGDLNLIYGTTTGKGRQNIRTRSVWDCFQALGFEFVGPRYPDGRLAAEPSTETPTDTRNVPTSYSRDGAASGVNVKTPLDARNQLDYVFASRGFHESIRARALNGVEEWGPSDHCRILIEIDE